MAAIINARLLSRPLVRLLPTEQGMMEDGAGRGLGVELVDPNWTDGGFYAGLMDLGAMLTDRNRYSAGFNTQFYTKVSAFEIDLFIFQDSATADTRVHIWPEAEAAPGPEPGEFFDAAFGTGLNIVTRLRIPGSAFRIEIDGADGAAIGLLEFGLYVRSH